MLKSGSNCWQLATATKASIIVDAEEYFRHAREAMFHAKHRIMLIGWEFDARIVLTDDAKDRGPAHLGAFITWLSDRNPALEIYLLRWDVGALMTLGRGSTILTVLNWLQRRRIHTMLDSVHPPGSSHHQKIVVIDNCFAFCGGIDMTSDRWDTRAHKDLEPGRHEPNGRPYRPWHDATTALQGPVARALAQLCRDRWHRAGGKPIASLVAACEYWPQGLEVQFSDAEVAIARSEPEMTGHKPVREIEQLYVDQILAARKFIYAENQYFASQKIAEAIAKRVTESDGPEIILINPEESDGWLQSAAMDSARARLFETIRRLDTKGRFRIYHPFTTGGKPIYVHAKIPIIDDRAIRVGSSNMNNRSMRLDTECDVVIDRDQPGNIGFGRTITSLRDGLIAEHLGVDHTTVAVTIKQTGSLIATIEHLRGPGKTLRPYQTPNLDDVQRWLADNEILDPEGPGEMFEPIAERGLLRNIWGHLQH